MSKSLVIQQIKKLQIEPVIFSMPPPKLEDFTVPYLKATATSVKNWYQEGQSNQ